MVCECECTNEKFLVLNIAQRLQDVPEKQTHLPLAQTKVKIDATVRHSINKLHFVWCCCCYCCRMVAGYWKLSATKWKYIALHRELLHFHARMPLRMCAKYGGQLSTSHFVCIEISRNAEFCTVQTFNYFMRECTPLSWHRKKRQVFQQFSRHTTKCF